MQSMFYYVYAAIVTNLWISFFIVRENYTIDVNCRRGNFFIKVEFILVM